MHGDQKRLRSRITSILRDPVWQMVGAVFTVLGLLTSIVVAYDVFRRSTRVPELTVEFFGSFDPLSSLKPESGQSRVALLVDGKPISSTTTLSTRIENSGSASIKPEDYLKPLRVTLDPSWVILAVESIYSRPKGIEPEWKRVSANTFEMEPILLNPSDVFNVMIWAVRSESERQNPSSAKPNPTWSARILNMSAIREIGPRRES